VCYLSICIVQPTQAEWVAFQVYGNSAALASVYQDPTGYIGFRFTLNLDIPQRYKNTCRVSRWVY
jgi:hypothetical protein